MSTILVRLSDAHRQPLAEPFDLRVIDARSQMLVRDARGATGEIRVEGLLEQPYIVRAYPPRHRAVAQFAVPRPGLVVSVDLFAPLDAAKAIPKFPQYEDLGPDLRCVLERSEGRDLYLALGDPNKACLLNLHAKMAQFGVWPDVQRVTRVLPDRLFADVPPALCDRVRADSRFRVVDGSLHTPPLGFCHAGSFKTREPHGNLQLTFFANGDAMKLDADIDDAAGLAHVFQVIGHALTHGRTHPYDIHEILVFEQTVKLPYSLA